MCLPPTSQHPFIVELQSAPLNEEAHAFLDGESMTELVCLQAFAAKLRYSFTVERLIEGGTPSSTGTSSVPPPKKK